MTLAGQTQTPTKLMSQWLAVFNNSDLSAIALFCTLGLLASIYFAIHLPAAASVITQFPD
jgi:hypothetical protein